MGAYFKRQVLVDSKFLLGECVRPEEAGGEKGIELAEADYDAFR